MITIERLKEYLDYKGIKNSQAEAICGFSNGLIGNAFRTKTSIGSDKLEKILSIYTDLSAEWLLRGVGSMLLDDKQQTGGENNKYFQLCKLLLENKQRDNELYSELAKLMRKE